MVKEVRFTLERSQYERLKELKDRRGYTWKGLMLEGSNCLQNGAYGLSENEMAAVNALVRGELVDEDPISDGELRALLESALEKIEKNREQ